MQISKSERNLSGIEFDPSLIEPPLFGEMLEQLSSLDKLHDKVDPKCLGEHMLHRDDEGMLNLNQDELFNFKTLKRVVVDHNIFSNTLHCVNLLIFLVLDKIDFSESASANQLEDLEVVKDELGHILLVVRHLLSAVNSLAGSAGRWHLGHVLPVDARLSAHGLLLVLNVLHYHIYVIVEDIVSFSLSLYFKAL